MSQLQAQSFLQERKQEGSYDSILRNTQDYKEFDDFFKHRVDTVKRTIILDAFSVMKYSVNSGTLEMGPLLSFLRLFVVNNFEVYGLLARNFFNRKNTHEGILLNKLLEKKLLIAVSNGEQAKQDIFAHAEKTDGLIVSNNRFRDMNNEKWKPLLENNLVHFYTLPLEKPDRFKRTRDHRHYMCDVRFGFFNSDFTQRCMSETFVFYLYDALYEKAEKARLRWSSEVKKEALQCLDDLIYIHTVEKNRDPEVNSLPPAVGTNMGNKEEEKKGEEEEVASTSEKVAGTSEEIAGTSEKVVGTSEEAVGTSEEVAATMKKMWKTKQEEKKKDKQEVKKEKEKEKKRKKLVVHGSTI
ncbi:unnamed protein product [Caenorhabditis auriculariae]|uniref:RNase NYN domain-containing protein n=1 Tax=Caenorhabditis auriculariae TaxID=2777116 RepID=A0A8S1H9C9_9PELO|nr:unnamed protein product [Caenorhabditis auriculariae]